MERPLPQAAIRQLLEAVGSGADATELAESLLEARPLVDPVISEDLFLGAFPSNLHPYRLASPELSLRAVRIGREWLLCHFCPHGTPVFKEGEPWPAREARILGDRDVIQLGGHRIDHDSLDLAAAWMDEMPIVRSIAETSGGDLLLSADCEPDHLALLRFDQGFSIVPLPGRAVVVNDRPVSESLPLFPSDLVRIGRFRGRAFDLIRRIGAGGGLLELKGVTKRFPDGAIGLREIELRLQSGDFVAIMGPSGSGKSTLLDIIAGAPASGGTVDAGDFRGSVAVVPQHDVLFETLSVEENLRHAGRLRGRMDEAAIQRRLDEVLQLIGLDEKRRLRAGSDLDKTLSGGQRRRLSIGLELMGNPLLLILDEPTSGLSGPDAASVVGLLRGLSARGTLVIATIHQPSAEIFACFDKLVVLDRGGVPAYNGYAAEAPAFFAGEAAGPETILGTIMRSARRPGEVAETRLYEPDHWGALYASKRPELEAPLVLSEKANALSSKNSASLSAASAPLRFVPASPLHQLACVTRREIARKLKEGRPFLSSLALTALLGSLIAIVCRQGEDYRYASNTIIPSYAFLAVILSQFLAASAAVGELVKDRGKQLREKMLEIGGGGYVLSKLPFLLLLAFIQAGIIAFTGYRILQIPEGFGAFWLLLGVAGFAAAALGLLVSAMPRMTETRAMAAVPLLLIPQIVLAGAEPFAFADLKHLHWPKKDREEEKTGAPWFAAPIPSRWAYEGGIDAWTGLPVFSQLETAKAERATLNFFKRYRKLFLEDRAAFEESFANQFERPFDPEEMKRNVGLLARAGILSEKDVRETYLIDYAEVAPDGADLKALQNDALLAHGTKVVRKDYRLFGKPAGAYTHGLTVLSGISAVALLLAMGLNRRSLRQPWLPLPRPSAASDGEKNTDAPESGDAVPVVALSPEFRALLHAQTGTLLPEPAETLRTLAASKRRPLLFAERGVRIETDFPVREFDPACLLARIVARKLALPLDRAHADAPLAFAIFTEPAWLPALGDQLVQIGQSLRRSGGTWEALPPELHFFVRPGGAPVPEPENLRGSAAVEISPWSGPLAAAEHASAVIFLLEPDTEEALAAWTNAVPNFARPILLDRKIASSHQSSISNAFGELIRYEWSTDSPYERLARQIHIEYSRVEAAARRHENQSPAIGKAWEELTEEYRGFSRDSATHLLASAQGLGFILSPPETPGDPVAKARLMKQLAARLEELAACEHYRWMSARVLKGWRHGPVRSDADKLHPDILPYDELPEATKEKDRACVRALAVMVQRDVFCVSEAPSSGG